MRRENDIHARCAELRARSARLRVRGAALRNTSRDTTIAREPASGGAVYDAPPPNPHDAALEALRLIRDIIDPFPIEWQVAIVKALTAWALVKAHERTRAPLTTALSA